MYKQIKEFTMNTLKKTIFLTNEEKNKGMGLLILENKGNNIFGTVKVYNSYPSSNYILGIKNNDKILKQNINLDSNIYNFILSDKINLDSNIGCVLLEQKNSNVTPILWGSEKSQNFKSQIVNNLRESISKLSTTRKQQPTFSQTNTPPSSTIIESQLSDCTTQSDWHSSHASITKVNAYIPNTQDDAFAPIQNVPPQLYESFSQISMQEEILPPESEIAIANTMSPQLFETDDNELEEVIDNAMKTEPEQKHKPHEFYDMISDQLDELFERYPEEENLGRLIENSKWVKIDKDGDNKHYVVGIIYHSDDIKYICYGVPGNYSNEPPQELIAYSQWLPTDTRNPYNNGYWVMYQDADTGENIQVN